MGSRVGRFGIGQQAVGEARFQLESPELGRLLDDLAHPLELHRTEGEALEIKSAQGRVALEGAKDAAGDALEGAKDAAGDAIEGAKDAAGDAAGKAVEGVKDAVDGAVEGAADAAKDALGGAKE